MTRNRVGLFWLTIVMMGSALCGPAWGQFRLPGGITINDPRRGNIPNLPGTHPERPDPNRVCPKTLEWIGILNGEYPGVDLAHMPGSRVQQMAVPLFADPAFQKEFGVSYPRLSDTERREFFRTHMIPCTTSREYAQQAMVLQIFNTPFMPGTQGMGPLAPGQLLPALNLLNTARATLQNDEQALAGKASAETYDRATALIPQRKEDLARVWPSEKAHFESVVKEAVARSASVAIEAKLQPLLLTPASLTAAKQLRDAPATYKALFAAMSPDQQGQWRAKLEDRHTAVLHELLPPEQARASAFPATQQGLSEGATWFSSFQGAFLQPPVPPEADAVGRAYLARREATLARMAPQLRQKLEATQDPETVAAVYEELFRLPEDRQTAAWHDLDAARSARVQLLTERAEQAHRAAEEKEERAALARGEIVASSLKTASLQNTSTFRALYTGDAAAAGLSRTNIVFTKLFEMYLIDFGQMCPNALPANRVQMTYEECTAHDHYTTYNGWYVNTTSECARYETRSYSPPAYADPRAYRAESGAEKMAELSFLQDSMKKVFTNPLSPISAMGDMVLTKASLEQDMPELIEQNGCGSKALTRLQENMTRLALGQDPLRLAGYVPDRTHTVLARDLDLRGLADDLIRADAAGWMLNQYQSLDTVAMVGDPDTEGRPRRLHATYSQQGLSREGSVDIAFTEGTPTCLYFADAPASCKSPSRAVVGRYQNGAYRSRSGR